MGQKNIDIAIRKELNVLLIASMAAFFAITMILMFVPWKKLMAIMSVPWKVLFNLF